MFALVISNLSSTKQQLILLRMGAYIKCVKNTNF